MFKNFSAGVGHSLDKSTRYLAFGRFNNVGEMWCHELCSLIFKYILYIYYTKRPSLPRAPSRLHYSKTDAGHRRRERLVPAVRLVEPSYF